MKENVGEEEDAELKHDFYQKLLFARGVVEMSCRV